MLTQIEVAVKVKQIMECETDFPRGSSITKVNVVWKYVSEDGE